jgi:hypothetical protein
LGNWNDTYVYYGGLALLDSTVDIVYTGRCLAVCDYNGDGNKDLITMHLTEFDSTRNDYDGEILFYYGDSTTPAIDTIPEYTIPLPTLYPTRDRFSFAAARPGIEYGDFNYDGKIDLVICSMGYPTTLNYGYLYIYMGNNEPADTATFKVRGKGYVTGEPPIIFYGHYFQIGDVNGDNYDDLLLSSRVETIPPNPQDSLDVLHIYLGGENFSFVEGGESLRYESRLKNSNYSYGWFKREISMMDINGDGFSDLIISQYLKDSTDHVHYGSNSALDTIPSFYLTDPDTTREDSFVGYMCHDVGDWNNDGYNDFLLKHSGFKSFTAHLGGPYINNRNPYGLKGLLEAFAEFPGKAINCSDQSGDGVNDFVVTANAYSQDRVGYIIIYRGRDDIVVGVDEEETETLPLQFRLEQNYPNPFNPSTTVIYQFPVEGLVTLKVYDLLGREVATLVNEQQQPGSYKVTWNSLDFASGIYFYQLKTKNYVNTKKMILLK